MAHEQQSLESKKTILIGSDQLYGLSKILKYIKRVPDYSYISATGSSDVIDMVNMVTPQLVVLNFDDNKRMLEEICPIVAERKTPILCLLNGFEDFYWSKYSIVFAQNLDHSLQNDRLSLLINSILLLQNHDSSVSMSGNTNQSLEEPPTYSMQLQQKVEVLKKVKNLLKDLYHEVDDPVKNRLLSIANLIKISISDNKHWDDFKLQFNHTHTGFLNTLNSRHPNLTNRDVKYCCYLKIGMSNEDIRHVLGINQESVSTHKYRLKRKLLLTKHQNLRRYIDSLS